MVFFSMFLDFLLLYIIVYAYFFYIFLVFLFLYVIVYCLLFLFPEENANFIM